MELGVCASTLMSDNHPGNRFIIFSLPRSGSTTLARLLNSHKDIRCLIEPFHPKRYGGRFRALATNEPSLNSALEMIWTKWNGIKHVWEANGWPFVEQPELNERIAVNGTVIFLMRRNLLRRLVSNYICRQTKYWIGSKTEFLEHVSRVELKELNPLWVRKQVHADEQAVAHLLQSLSASAASVIKIYYEDIYSETSSRQERFRFVNVLLDSLCFEPISFETFASCWEPYFDPALNQWASPEVYRRIPAIDRIEKEVGCNQTGWLFR